MRRIFGERDRRRGARRGVIDVRQVDGKGLVVGQPAPIRHPHRHAMARGRFVVQQRPVGHRDDPGRPVDRKPPARAIEERVALAVPGIHVGPGDRPHHRPVRRILCYRIRRQAQVCRGLIYIAYRHRDGLCVDTPVAVRHLHRDVVDIVRSAVGRRFIVRRGHEPQRARTVVDRKLGCVRTAADGIGEGLPAVAVGCRHGGDDGGVFIDSD